MSEREERLTALLRRLDAPAPSPELRGRVMSIVRATPRRLPWSWTRRLALAGSLAAALLVGRLAVPGEPPVTTVPRGELSSDVLIAQHVRLAAGGALGDGALLHALGAQADRDSRSRL